MGRILYRDWDMSCLGLTRRKIEWPKNHGQKKWFDILNQVTYSYQLTQLLMLYMVRLTVNPIIQETNVFFPANLGETWV